MVKESFTLTDVIVTIDGNIVGGAQSVNITRTQENKVLHEAGSKHPREIMDGPISINGTIERLFLDKETITDLVDLEEGNNPYFTFVGVTKNKIPQKKVIVSGSKIKGLTLDMNLSDETKAPLEFDALRLDIQ